MSEHAARFTGGRAAAPSTVAPVVLEGRTMRQLVATMDLPAHTRVAAYPVEVVPDDDDHDDEYAIGIFQEYSVVAGGRRFQREFDDVSGVPTRKSLRRKSVDGLPTIAMFANEPDAAHAPNCELVFPSTTAARVRLGDVYSGYLETTAPVSKGEALTWCYGSSYLDRGYKTSCSEPSR